MIGLYLLARTMFRLIFFSCWLSHLTLAFHHAGGINPTSRPTEKTLHVHNNMKDSVSTSSENIPMILSSHYQQPKQSMLYSTTKNSNDVATSSSSSNGKFDVTAVLKYGVAITVQMTLITALFRTMDALVSYSKLQKVPFLYNCIFFYGFALKSRIFNPMSNTRPQVKTLEAVSVDDTTSMPAVTTDPNSRGDASTTTSNKKGDIAKMFQRKMPSWTPPGIVFPIVWLLIIGPIRAVTTSMIYTSVGSYASVPILSLALHLSIGDVWNTINNIERRFGVAVTGVFCVWLSKAHAAYQYRLVNPFAGTLLGATLIWLTIASALVTATWRLNPDPETGKPEPLYPVFDKATTKFAWFSQKS